MLSLAADGAGAATARLLSGIYHLRITSPGFRDAECDVAVAGWADEKVKLEGSGMVRSPCCFDSPPPVPLIPSELTLRLPESRLHRLMHRK